MDNIKKDQYYLHENGETIVKVQSVCQSGVDVTIVSGTLNAFSIEEGIYPFHLSTFTRTFSHLAAYNTPLGKVINKQN